MLFFENVLLALNGLWSNKMRSFLTMLGIIIGIGSVIAIMTVGDSLMISVSDQMQSMGANNVEVVLSNRTEDGNMFEQMMSSMDVMPDEDDYFTTEMLEKVVKQFPDKIETITVAEQAGQGTINHNNKEENINIYGINNGYFLSSAVKLLSGRVFSENDLAQGKKVCIISSKACDNMYGKDKYKEALGKTIEVTQDGLNVEYTIIGVYEYQAMGMMAMLSNVATEFYIPIKTAKSFTHSGDKYMYFEIVTKLGVDSELFANEVSRFFDGIYRNNEDFEVTAFSMSSMVSTMTSMLGTITTAISVVAGIALLVGGIGVMNIMLVSITERTREIGTRKALGATNLSIRIQFIIEAVIICVIGGIIGIIVGLVMGSTASKLLGYPAVPSIKSIVVSLSFSMAIGVFFGYYPANKAAKMNPIDALRYE